MKSDQPDVARLERAWRNGRGLGERFANAWNFARHLLDNRMLGGAQSRVQIAILLRGGVGDVMIAARWLRTAFDAMAESADFVADLYYALPENIAFIFGNFSEVRYVYHEITFEYIRGYYDFHFVINHLGYIEMDVDHAGDLPFKELVRSWGPGVEMFSPFTTDDYHPDLGRNFAGLIERLGFRRHTILEAQTGLKAPVAPFPFRLPPRSEISALELPAAPYVTVHDGWDAQLRIGSRRPTKAWPTDRWADLMAHIKRASPGVGVVQIGGRAGANIPGVDLDLKGAISLPVAARVLRGAAAHVDTDSGLVHVAASLGTRAVVIFGPTDRTYFGYPGNLNLASDACRSCWLKTGNWVDSCMIGDVRPRCMTGVEPGAVATALAELLKRVLSARSSDRTSPSAARSRSLRRSDKGRGQGDCRRR
ncbi:MAG: glycosyltransferase family 9 protein [Caulobacteraceae bacterium]